MTSCNSWQYLGKILAKIFPRSWQDLAKILLRYPWWVDPGVLSLQNIKALSCFITRNIKKIVPKSQTFWSYRVSLTRKYQERGTLLGKYQ